jgi:hypothetical protein
VLLRLSPASAGRHRAQCPPRADSILTGVTEANWRDGTAKDPHFIISESPAYVGRAVAALAADPKVDRWTGQALSSWQLAAGPSATA